MDRGIADIVFQEDCWGDVQVMADPQQCAELLWKASTLLRVIHGTPRHLRGLGQSSRVAFSDYL
jgi:hypothetical protein